MVLWCVDGQSMDRTEAAALMERADRRLKPPKGSYLVAGEAWAESPKAGEGDSASRDGEQEAGIHQLTVGYDRLKLLPLVEALSDTRDSAITT